MNADDFEAMNILISQLTGIHETLLEIHTLLQKLVQMEMDRE